MYDRRHFLAAAAAAGGGLALRAPATPATPSAEAAAPRAAGSTAPGPFQFWPDHSLYSYQLLRTYAKSVVGAADFTEAYFAAEAIGETPSAAAYVSEFEALGRAKLAKARQLSRKDPVLARSVALRATEYLRAADFFLYPDTDLARKVALYRQVRAAFHVAVPTAEAVQVPYGKSFLYAYWIKPQTGQPGPYPVVICFGGLDSVVEELHMVIGTQLSQNGIAALVVDGPGQGASLMLNKILGRYDFEVAARACVNYLYRRRDVSRKRIGLIGGSLGGYYAARCAAFEHRLRTAVCQTGLFDLTEAAKYLAGNPESLASLFRYADWVLGTKSPAETLQKVKQFRLEGVAEKIRCPTLIVHGGGDTLVSPTQAQQLYAAIRAPKKLVITPADQPGSQHNQADSMPVGWEIIIPWFHKQLVG